MQWWLRGQNTLYSHAQVRAAIDGLLDAEILSQTKGGDGQVRYGLRHGALERVRQLISGDPNEPIGDGD